MTAHIPAAGAEGGPLKDWLRFALVSTDSEFPKAEVSSKGPFVQNI